MIDQSPEISPENELKLVLTGDEYVRLGRRLGTADQEIQQTNHYFDGPDFELARRGVMIRAREGRKLQLTVKIGAHVGQGLFKSREYDWALTRTDLEALVAGTISPSELFPRLERLIRETGEVPPLRYRGASANLRRLYERSGGWEITLDATDFPVGEIEYEMEVEFAGSPEAQIAEVERLLEELEIPRRAQVKTKYHRFIDRLSSG